LRAQAFRVKGRASIRLALMPSQRLTLEHLHVETPVSGWLGSGAEEGHGKL